MSAPLTAKIAEFLSYFILQPTGLYSESLLKRVQKTFLLLSKWEMRIPVHTRFSYSNICFLGATQYFSSLRKKAKQFNLPAYNSSTYCFAFCFSGFSLLVLAVTVLCLWFDFFSY